MIRFACPKCQTALQAAAEQAGAAVACPRCQTQVRIPSPKMVSQPVAPASQPASAAAPAPWYYSRDGERHGPFTTAQLKQLAQTGELQPTDSVWKEGMPKWRAASEVKGLFDAPRPAQPRAKSAVPPLPPTPAAGGADLAGSDGSRKDRTGKNKPGLAPRTKYLLIGAAVAVPLLLIGLTVVLLVGKSSRTPQGGERGERTEKTGDGPNGSLTEKTGDRTENNSVPDFTKVDYSVDFSKVDYSKGPMGQTLEGRKYNNAEGEPISATGYTQGGKFLLHGKVTGSFRSGKARSEVWWFAGQGHGMYKEWYENGQLREQGNNKDGLKHGKIQTWREDGTQWSEEWYVNGYPHGTFIEWHQNGKKSEEVAFVNGLAEGRYTAWYPNSQVAEEGVFLKGCKTGKWRSWYADGGQYRLIDSYVPNPTFLKGEASFSPTPYEAYEFIQGNEIAYYPRPLNAQRSSETVYGPGGFGSVRLVATRYNERGLIYELIKWDWSNGGRASEKAFPENRPGAIHASHAESEEESAFRTRVRQLMATIYKERAEVNKDRRSRKK